jgi:CheY-like chemotaxis protein
MRILVADDDRVMVAMMTGLLKAKGHQVVPVFDAMQAVMFSMRAPAPDAIILDINMPGGTGIEALKRIRSSLKTALIPVVVVSSNGDPQLPEKTRRLGADGFFKKPVDPAALLAALTGLVTGE